MSTFRRVLSLYLCVCTSIFSLTVSGAPVIVPGTPAQDAPAGDPRQAVDDDGDGIPDFLEIANGLNPDANDADLDNDGDFLSNYEEVILLGTNPNVADAGLAPDTDGDGIVDKVELAFGTDPEKQDSLGFDSEDLKYTMHVLNRLTFGPTSSLVAEINQKTIPVWIAEQLVPIGLDKTPPDPAQVLRDNYVVQSSVHIHRVGPMRPVHSQKQLQARMAWFWDNHFNTAIQVSQRANEELWEEDQFFLNAFGNFKDLVKISAKSYNMLTYLNLASNTRNAFNENYSREVMELHTTGQTVSDPGAIYNATDIAELARILTGWSFTRSAQISRYGLWNGTDVVYDPLILFDFKSGSNDTGTKTFLGESFGAGLSEGEKALDLIATRPETANAVCKKLARYFVSDNPALPTVVSCQAVFLANRDASNQIALVLADLFESDEFRNPVNQRSKFKDNQEYLFSVARFLGYSAEGNPDASTSLNNTALGERTALVGQQMYAMGTPDGWPETGDFWTTTSSALSRFTQGNQMVLQVGTGAQDISLVDYFAGLGLTAPKDIVSHLYMLLLGSNYNEEHVYLAYRVLGLDSGNFSLTGINAEAKLEQLVARIVQLPEFNLH